MRLDRHILVKYLSDDKTMYESHTTIISSTEKATLIPAIVTVTVQLITVIFYTLSASAQNLIT